MGQTWCRLCSRPHACIACVVAVVLSLSANDALAQIKSFPQAEGFGASAAGGRGGDVYHVINLNNSGNGSLRYGIENAPSAGRTIVFDVGGWIDITSKLGVDTNIHNLTIAGQTAPGGIGVRGAQFSVGGDDVIVRHLRFRPGDAAGGDNDSINTNENAQRVIYDHVSAEFSTDGGFDNQATDVTLQFSSVSYGLETHSTGSLLENPDRLSLHHNLYAHNNTRNPKHRVWGLDWVNNVIYNWNTRAVEMQGTSDPSYQWTANIDGNYFIAGPNHGNVAPLSGGSTQNYETWLGVNAYDNDGDTLHDGKDYKWGDRDLGTFTTAATRWKNSTANPTPFPVADEIWKDASTGAAYTRVLSEFGATPWARDEVNEVLHDSVVNRDGNILNDEIELVALGVSNGGFGTLGGVATPVDTDQDGMPDDWETKHGLPTNSPSNNGDYDADGYTNLEEYLNNLAAFKATGPLEFDGSGRYADWSNWTRRWEPSRADDVHVNVGTATVDAIGQRAGTLRIGATPGSNGTLNIESGWLEVTNEVVIGADPAATAVLNLSGGSLITPMLAQGPGGTFNFTGGELHADTVGVDLAVNGGTLSPGNSIGQTHVMDDVAINSGSLAIELASDSPSDTLLVDGSAKLGGALDVSLLGSFTPTLGDNWQIIIANDLSGTFDALTDGYSLRKLGNDVILYFGPAPVELAGDFNGDGTVDGVDYTVWRDSLNTHTPFFNETASLSVVDGEDYDAWKANFGATAGGGSASLQGVPEPASFALLIVAALIGGFSVRAKRDI